MAPAAVPVLLRTLLVPTTAPFDEAELANGLSTTAISPPHLSSALWNGPDAVAEARLDAAAERLRGCKRICAFTGAGISAESGMPTFRETVDTDEPIGRDGLPMGACDLLTPLWDAVDPAKAADIEAFHSDPDRYPRTRHYPIPAHGSALIASPPRSRLLQLVDS